MADPRTGIKLTQETHAYLEAMKRGGQTHSDTVVRAIEESAGFREWAGLPPAPAPDPEPGQDAEAPVPAEPVQGALAAQRRLRREREARR
ncbi:hypothetical protein [Actinomadura sp. K4S16]|uniref:hypothetical protein n=1 Tax=Actinomadura sp. K4S16 TaxID=1316147 RepID=UPI0011EEE19A|nr:hypothetical protein [Actinomadura sp. K4S16]